MLILFLKLDIEIQILGIFFFFLTNDHYLLGDLEY